MKIFKFLAVGVMVIAGLADLAAIALPSASAAWLVTWCESDVLGTYDATYLTGVKMKRIPSSWSKSRDANQSLYPIALAAIGDRIFK